MPVVMLHNDDPLGALTAEQARRIDLLGVVPNPRERIRFMHTLRHGFVAALAALALAGFGTPASAAEPDVESAQCRLSAEVVVASVDDRVRGIGAVACPNRVFQILVGVVLTRDNLEVARDRTLCQNVAGCRIEVAAANPPSLNLWCAVATGRLQLSPLGPVIDLGSQRACERG
jgi:hypothetical protein